MLLFHDRGGLFDDLRMLVRDVILFRNILFKVVQFVFSDKNFAKIRMPNEKNFSDDPRPDTPVITAKEPCMKDCKPDVKITMRARILDVTPDTETPNVKVD